MVFMSFVSDPLRDAGPIIAGFFFQVNMTILRWFDLEPETHLELECGEDIDTVGADTGGENAAEKRLSNGLSKGMLSGNGRNGTAKLPTAFRLSGLALSRHTFCTSAEIGHRETRDHAARVG
jgi:hypothetical protein